MTDSTRNEMLEIYKLHAELADRVSQRREGANRLYRKMRTLPIADRRETFGPSPVSGRRAKTGSHGHAGC